MSNFGMPNGLFGMGSPMAGQGQRLPFMPPWGNHSQPQPSGPMPPPMGGQPPTAQPSMIQALLGRMRGGQQSGQNMPMMGNQMFGGQ